MKSKRILLPEIRGPARKAPKPNSKFLISDRQRNEAIGLVMVGGSAFSLSLLHYLDSAKISGIVNWAAVNFGMGLYILPVIVGIMGVQRFMERSFQNAGARTLGIIGTLIFGLGLLGLEGGKIGTFTFSFFATHVGTVPSQILFVFLCLASLIFALDILYKDVLGFTLLLSELLANLAVFIWEACIAGLALAIGAFQQTFMVISLIFSRVLKIYRYNQPVKEEGESSEKLISFTSKMSSGDAQEISIAEMATVPAPGSENSEMPNRQLDGLPAPDGSMGSVAVRCTQLIENIAFPGAFATLATSPATQTSNVIQKAPEATGKEEETVTGNKLQTNPAPGEGPFEEPKEPESREKGSKEIESHEEAAQEKDDREENDRAENDRKNSPVSLDDHPIDQGLKEEEGKAYKKAELQKPEFKHSALPPTELLHVPAFEGSSENDLSQRSALLLKTLEDFGLRVQITAIVEGPAVSRFEIRPAPGVKVSRITSLVDDIALALSAQSIRIEAPIPGKSAMGIEIPNLKPTPVFFYDLVKNENFRTQKTLLNLALGLSISRRPVYADLGEMPHLLIAGSTGSGKSVCINTIIASILFQARPDQVKLVMIDPKMVELTGYNGIPHLISPVVTDPKLAADALQWAVEEMVRRYEFLSSVKARNISDYNRELPRLKEELEEELEPMPLIVIIIDELADLMMTSSAQVEGAICRLSQMARAVGIHLVIATQRPSVDVLTGLIKANLPSRIAFFVSSQIDSRTIIDEKGAEKLLGKGDMLFKFKGRPMPLRVQGAYISDKELASLTEFAKQQGNPEYINIQPDKDPSEASENSGSEDADDGDEDAHLFAQIEEYLSSQEKTSTSMLQRKFKIGYNRAARIMDLLEEKGFVSPLDGSNKRRVLCRRSIPLS